MWEWRGRWLQCLKPIIQSLKEDWFSWNQKSWSATLQSDQCRCWVESKAPECPSSMYGLLLWWGNWTSPEKELVRACETWFRPRSDVRSRELLLVGASFPLKPHDTVGKWFVAAWADVVWATSAPSEFNKAFTSRADVRFLEPHVWFDRRERAQDESVTPLMHSPEGFPGPEKLVPPAETGRKSSDGLFSELLCQGWGMYFPMAVMLWFPGTRSDAFVPDDHTSFPVIFGYALKSIRKLPTLLLFSIIASSKQVVNLCAKLSL